jgi:GNAT superfamily N-acetyltransferase
MNAEIRLARLEDALAIGRVQVRSWQSAYATFLDPDWLAALSAEEWGKGWEPRLVNPQRRGPLVAVVDASVVAFSAFGRVEPAYPLPADYAELYTLYVDPDYFSRGLGALLLDASLNRLREAGYKHVALWCYEPNHGARRFYEREGWHPNGQRRSYESGPDAVRYVRELAIDANPRAGA